MLGRKDSPMSINGIERGEMNGRGDWSRFSSPPKMPPCAGRHRRLQSPIPSQIKGREGNCKSSQLNQAGGRHRQVVAVHFSPIIRGNGGGGRGG